jgi:hypothetical protein
VTRYFVIVAAHGATKLHTHVAGKHGRIERAVLFEEPAQVGADDPHEGGMVYGAVEYVPPEPAE